ncbi:hypothetical protein TNCT_339461 [Trichonephila clavata]|uniref:Uncharacterized protein n=1 Tax=Trichonephila clavata TaxID=2740835 RepID=A0A8X6IUQ5_TRICU|nr:hypothetical protein TNCT_339461 [Trichonephila clavata]
MEDVIVFGKYGIKRVWRFLRKRAGGFVIYGVRGHSRDDVCRTCSWNRGQDERPGVRDPAVFPHNTPYQHDPSRRQ